MLLQEWEDEEDVRDMYDITPPVSVKDFDDEADLESDMYTMPRASVLNQSRGINSLRSLVARHDSEKMNMELIKEESSRFKDLGWRGGEEYDVSDSNANTSTDEELGLDLDDEDTGSEAAIVGQDSS
jgi:hypothetical protein